MRDRPTEWRIQCVQYYRVPRGLNIVELFRDGVSSKKSIGEEPESSCKKLPRFNSSVVGGDSLNKSTTISSSFKGTITSGISVAKDRLSLCFVLIVVGHRYNPSLRLLSWAIEMGLSFCWRECVHHIVGRWISMTLYCKRYDHESATAHPRSSCERMVTRQIHVRTVIRTAVLVY
jgi:hypothetical protein